MKELVSQLMEKANLSEEQAAQAAGVVKDFLHEKLPDAIRGPVESILTGEALQDGLDKAKGALGGLFG